MMFLSTKLVSGIKAQLQIKSFFKVMKNISLKCFKSFGQYTLTYRTTVQIGHLFACTC